MTDNANGDRLVRAYNRMTERVKHSMDEFAEAEYQVVSQLRKSIQRAAERAVELGELTHDEAQLIGGYLRRDLEDAGHYLATTGRDLSGWLKFDFEYTESQMLDWFRSAADKTRLDMLRFNAELERASHYYTGEITGPGTLRCDNCGKQLSFTSGDRIPSCPTCDGQQFSRVSAGDDRPPGDSAG